MSLEPNSVRFQRLTKTMDLCSARSSSMMMENTSEMVKLPTLRAINKGIKYNDLSFTTPRDMNKLKKEPEQVQNIEEASAHHSLVLIRKRYDHMSKDRQQTQQRVDKLQTEHDKLTNDKNNFLSAKNGGKEKVSQLDSSLKAMKLQVEEADIERKIMQNMISRIKKDKVVYDFRKYNMEKELEKTKKFKSLIQQESTKIYQEDSKAQKLKNKMIRHITNQKGQRDFHLDKVQSILNDKEDMITNQEIRGEYMKEVAIATIQDKDLKEKSWYKCYLCQRFVQKILRDKMTREMMKFNVVEVAFKNIKTATGVSNAQTLIKKFLNKEDTYGDLLGKIAENQSMIAIYKGQGEELLKETRELEVEQERLNQTKVEAKDLSQEQKEFNLMSEKGLLAHTYQQKMSSWLIRNLKKFDVKKEESEEGEGERPQDNKTLLANFKAYIDNMNKNIEELASLEDNEDAKTEDTNVKLGKKNMRITIGGQEDKAQIDEKKYYEEEQVLDGERASVLRNNEKFMRELKKKAEQQKKAQIEAMPKKKEAAPAEKPKAAPVDQA